MNSRLAPPSATLRILSLITFYSFIACQPANAAFITRTFDFDATMPSGFVATGSFTLSFETTFMADQSPVSVSGLNFLVDGPVGFTSYSNFSGVGPALAIGGLDGDATGSNGAAGTINLTPLGLTNDFVLLIFDPAGAASQASFRLIQAPDTTATFANEVTVTASSASVPLPGSIWLMGAGILAIRAKANWIGKKHKNN